MDGDAVVKTQALAQTKETEDLDRRPAPQVAAPFALQAIIDGLSDELIVLDLEQRIQLANKAALERWNGEGELVGRACHEVYFFEQPCHSSECECPVPMVLQTGQTVRVTHRLESDGRVRYVDVVASPLRDDSGHITHIIELMRDVTEQRKLEDTLVLRNEQLSTLNSLARTVSHSLDLDEVLTRALDHITEMAKMDVAAIFLLQERLGDLQLKALHGFSEESARLVSKLGLLEGDCGGVINTGKMVVVPDLNCYGRSGSRVVGREKLRSLVHVPLNAKGDTLGSMCVGNRVKKGFSQEDLDFLSAVGDQIAMAVENARLYAEIRRKERMRGGLLQKVITAQEEERKRIARELHDETSQALTALLYEVEEALEGQCDEESAQTLEHVRTLTTQTLEGIHKMIYDLRPSLLDHLGLSAAVRWLAETRLEANGVRVRLDEDPNLGRLPAEMEIALFRVVQEAISNILRHAGARNVIISLQKRDGQLHMAIEDDGIGFDMDEIVHGADTSRGLGLLGMSERAQLFGGSLYINSTLGEGTCVYAQIPLEEREGETGG